MIEDQPSTPSSGDVWRLVMAALVDAYQEALDLAVHLRQAIEERRKG